MTKQTSECKFEMFYPVRYYESNEYHNFKYVNVGRPSRLFRLTNVKNIRVSKNGNILERIYYISFDTILGYLFIQNCVSGYTDLLPEKFYKMTDYAQLFYRMLILPYYGNAKNPLSFEEIKARLDLKSDNSMCRKVIERILDELESYSFIKDYDIIKNHKQYEYEFTKNSWKDINNTSTEGTDN